MKLRKHTLLVTTCDLYFENLLAEVARGFSGVSGGTSPRLVPSQQDGLERGRTCKLLLCAAEMRRHRPRSRRVSPCVSTPLASVASSRTSPPPRRKRRPMQKNLPGLSHTEPHPPVSPLLAPLAPSGDDGLPRCHITPVCLICLHNMEDLLT